MRADIKDPAPQAFMNDTEFIAVMAAHLERMAMQAGLLKVAQHLRLAAVAAALAVTTVPADAHCYTRWYYPTPQHCRAGPERIVYRHAFHLQRFAKAVDEPVKPPPDPTEGAGDGKTPQPVEVGEDRSWYVEITKMPPEDEEHQRAIEVLKRVMSPGPPVASQ